jgi:hypothetical protein
VHSERYGLITPVSDAVKIRSSTSKPDAALEGHSYAHYDCQVLNF